MKQHNSVFSLMIRSSLWPALVLLLLMTAAQLTGFWLVLQQHPLPLEVTVQKSFVQWISLAALVGLTLLLCRVGCSGSCKPCYTLERLSISRRACFGWQALANGLFFVLFWAVQTLVAVLLCHIFTTHGASEYVTHQSTFLAFFRSPFLHTLLPFNDWLLWISNAVTLLALAVCSARFPLSQQEGHKFHEIYLVLLITILTRNHEIFDLPRCIFSMIVCIAAIAFSLFQVSFREEPSNEEV